MRKWLLAAFLVFTLALPAQAAQTVVGFITGASGLGDLSFNDMAYGGIRRAQQEYNFKLIILKPDKSGVTTPEGVLSVVGQSDIIVLLGAQHEQQTRQAALANPEKKFIYIELPVEGAPNISSVMFNQNEGSFLAGALAALVSKTGKIGFVGGTREPPVMAFEQGYREGAAYADPDVEVLAEYISPAGDFSGFGDPEKGHDITMKQYDQGADIVFAVAGLSGNGVIEAARRSGKFAIGVDSDQDSLAKGSVLTSMMKRLDVAAYAELKAALENRFTPGVTRYGLANDGVALTEMKYTRHLIPADVFDKIEDITRKIVSGKLKVTNLLPSN
ncbi:BMP family lipoprotein [Pseudodesulfovibrio portus]|uniref:BMP family ABC transporter substrate-binding protein n=1 Tax=Pseudodesulfovibrio portus TaxID=231439 RepID=A0ABN6RSU5_9BACT|nr:BMP family ABC transporter substrate-binding protein [Pseudodesulfovibrio portus]BDQ34185.1 BMP family ABC transporter substrate-binding protein [Pseudodesulfovibrio portus]